MKKSTFGTLNWSDFGKGALVAVLTAVFATLTSLLQTGTLFDKASLPIIGTAALTAFLAYISKNLFSNSSGQFATNEKGKGLKFPKALILIFAFSALGLIANAQVGLLNKVPKQFNQLVASDNKSLMTEIIKGTWIPRLTGGVMGFSWYKDKITGEAKKLDFSALSFGIGYLHYKNDNGTSFNDFGINLLYLQNINQPGAGVGIYGSYNIKGTDVPINIGVHRDFFLKVFMIDTGLTYHF